MRRHVPILALLILVLGLLPASAQDPPHSPVYEAVDLADGADMVLARARAIDLDAYPVIPTATARTKSIFQRGQALGRDVHTLSKVGDCNSVDWFFLQPSARANTTWATIPTCKRRSMPLLPRLLTGPTPPITG